MQPMNMAVDNNSTVKSSAILMIQFMKQSIGLNMIVYLSKNNYNFMEKQLTDTSKMHLSSTKLTLSSEKSITMHHSLVQIRKVPFWVGLVQWCWLKPHFTNVKS